MTDDLARRAGRDATATPFKSVALVLQGGGALGSYQGGVYQALAEANVHPDWVSGISIGAVNSALIAGNAPEKRVEKLREFWETVSKPPLGPFGTPYNPSIKHINETMHRALNQFRALGIAALGAPGFFRPRVPSPVVWPAPSPAQLSHYDVSPLKETLERLVDFDRLNSGELASQRRRGQRPQRQFYLFRHHHPSNRFRAHHGERLAAPRLSRDRNRRRILLGRRLRLQHAAAMGARFAPSQGHPHVPGRSVERHRRTARATFRKPRCGRRTSMFSSRTREARRTKVLNAQRLRRVFRQVYEHLPEDVRALPEVAFLAREADESSTTSCISSITRRITRARRRITSSRAAPWKSIGAPAISPGRKAAAPSRSASTPAQSRGRFACSISPATARAELLFSTRSIP